MKLILLDALHARPANLFVRVAASFVSVVEVRKGERRANAKNILEVLTLGAAKGDALEIAAEGDDAESALAALVTLVERNFDADLVPETGAAAASGIAVGPAVVLDLAVDAPDAPSAADSSPGAIDSPLAVSPHETRARLALVFAEVRGELSAMMRALPPIEAPLFEPEIAIVSALEAPIAARVRRGETFEHALNEEVPARRNEATGGTIVTGDLLLDARRRLLDAYRGEGRSDLARRLALGPQGDVVLVVHELTPSVVAALPRRVTGIVAALDEGEAGASGVGYASHAAILARGRGIPLLIVAPHVAEGIGDGDAIVVDTRASPPRLWTSPSPARIAEAEAALAEELRQRQENEAASSAPLTHLASYGGAPLAVRVNIGTVHDYVPVASDGVGLVRTELLHSGRRRPPDLDEQLAMLALVAGKVATGPIVVRLFDGGGDKPLAWLPPPSGAPGARGIELLFHHPHLLRTQIDAVAQVKARADVRLLIPIVRDAADVEQVRSFAPASLPLGAMIETPAAVAAAASIAAAADFVCIGTNDLTALVRHEDRATAAGAIDARVLAMIAEVVDVAHRAGRSVTICGEIAGEAGGAMILVGLGVDAISVAPSRLLAVRNALVTASAASCREAAQSAMGKERSTP